MAAPMIEKKHILTEFPNFQYFVHVLRIFWVFDTQDPYRGIKDSERKKYIKVKKTIIWVIAWKSFWKYTFFSNNKLWSFFFGWKGDNNLGQSLEVGKLGAQLTHVLGSRAPRLKKWSRAFVQWEAAIQCQYDNELVMEITVRRCGWYWLIITS